MSPVVLQTFAMRTSQGQVWFTYICHYSTWATEVLSKCIVCPKGGCYSCATRPGNVTIYDLLWMYPTAPRYGCTPLPLAMDVPHCPSLWVYPTAPHHGCYGCTPLPLAMGVPHCPSPWACITFCQLLYQRLGTNNVFFLNHPNF